MVYGTNFTVGIFIVVRIVSYPFPVMDCSGMSNPKSAKTIKRQSFNATKVVLTLRTSIQTNNAAKGQIISRSKNKRPIISTVQVINTLDETCRNLREFTSTYSYRDPLVNIAYFLGIHAESMTSAGCGFQYASAVRVFAAACYAINHRMTTNADIATGNHRSGSPPFSEMMNVARPFWGSDVVQYPILYSPVMVGTWPWIRTGQSNMDINSQTTQSLPAGTTEISN